MRSLSTLLLFCLLSLVVRRPAQRGRSLPAGKRHGRAAQARRHVSIRLVVGSVSPTSRAVKSSCRTCSSTCSSAAWTAATRPTWKPACRPSADNGTPTPAHSSSRSAATQRQVLDLLDTTPNWTNRRRQAGDRARRRRPLLAPAALARPREPGSWRHGPTGGGTGPGLLPARAAGAARGSGKRAAWYVPGNMTLVLVGDLDPRLPAYLTRTFGALEDHEVPERRELPAANGMRCQPDP